MSLLSSYCTECSANLIALQLLARLLLNHGRQVLYMRKGPKGVLYQSRPLLMELTRVERGHHTTGYWLHHR